MELIIGILMLFGIASAGAEAETETTANPEIKSAVIESMPVVQPAPKAADNLSQECLTHHPRSIYRDLTLPYESQQRTAAPCFKNYKGACSDE
jgi:hypothetical protein